MQIDPFTIVWLAGSSGFFATLTAVAVTWITKRSDDRRHRREITFKLALDHWKHNQDSARFLAEKNPGTKVEVESLEMHVIQALVMSDILAGKPSARDIATKLRDSHAIYDAARREANKYHEALEARNKT